MIRILTVCMLAILAVPIAADEVGALGDPARLDIEGAKSFASEDIKRALAGDVDFLLAAHPDAPLAEFLAALRDKALAGFRDAGFPDAAVEARVDAQIGRVVVRVDEGPRFMCGAVRVEGARTAPAEKLVERLTQRSYPSDTVTEEVLVNGKPVLRRVDADGKEVETGNPWWTPGKPAPFASAAFGKFERPVRDFLSEYGLFFPKAKVRLRPDKDKGAADLVVEIEDEGPQGILGSIEVVGAQINTPQDVIAYLGLKPGMAIDRETLTRAELRLWRSARFLRYKVTPQPPAAEGEKVALRIELKEYSQSQPLTKDFSPEEKMMLRVRDRLARFSAGQEDCVLTLDDPEKRFVFRFIMSPRGGAIARIDNTEALGQPRISYAFMAAPGKAALLAPGHRRQLAGSGKDCHALAKLDVGVKPNAKDDAPPFYIGFHAGFHTKGDEPFRVLMSLAPAAFVGPLHQKGRTVSLEKDGLTLRDDASIERVRPDAVDLLETTVLKEGGTFPFRVQLAPGVFDRERESFEKAAADCRNEFDPDKPISSLVEFFAAELPDAIALFQKGGAEKRPDAAAWVALFSVLGRPVLEPLDRLFGEDAPAQKDTFYIPTKDADPGSNTLQGGLLWALPWCDRLLPRDSWPWILWREATFAVSGKGTYTLQELGRIFKSDRTGPVGFLATAKLLQLAHDASNARAFAARGLERLSAADFRKDYRILFEGDSLLARGGGKAADLLRTLDVAAIESLTAPLAPADGELVRRCAKLLREDPKRPPLEALTPALDDYWDKALKSKVEAELKALLDPGPAVEFH